MEEQTADNVRWSVAGDIGRIVLDRSDGPHTISLASTAALARAVAEIAAAKPRVVLLTGSGTIFCAGGDIAEMRQHAETLDVYIDELVGIAHPALLRLSELPVPVVTAINGPVGGGGIGWALCGDFALAAASMKLAQGTQPSACPLTWAHPTSSPDASARCARASFSCSVTPSTRANVSTSAWWTKSCLTPSWALAPKPCANDWPVRPPPRWLASSNCAKAPRDATCTSKWRSRSL